MKDCCHSVLSPGYVQLETSQNNQQGNIGVNHMRPFYQNRQEVVVVMLTWHQKIHKRSASTKATTPADFSFACCQLSCFHVGASLNVQLMCILYNNFDVLIILAQ